MISAFGGSGSSDEGTVSANVTTEGARGCCLLANRYDPSTAAKAKARIIIDT
jgi:hypothetical protein